MLTKPLIQELRQIEAASLNFAADFSASAASLSALRDRAERLRRSHSNSFFGDHAFTYYEDFEQPTRGFDVEWGLLSGFNGAHNPGWRVHSIDELIAFLYEDGSYEQIEQESKSLKTEAERLRDKALDLLSVIEEESEGTVAAIAVESKRKITKAFENGTAETFARSAVKSAPTITRDSRNIHQGMRIPAHVSALSQVHFRAGTEKALLEIAASTRRILGMSQLKRRASGRDKAKARAIFIGHGRSAEWRELQAFLEKELGLEVEEFNRVSVAGITTQARLEEMLTGSAMAFLVMTGEDQTAEGEVRARENVIHEAGLFQGKLGWTRAIVLLEEGCGEFSNIHGVNHISFRKHRIKDAFVDVRRVLVREGLLQA